MEIDREFIEQVAADLVRINSVNPTLAPGGPGEREVAAYTADLMDRLGLEVGEHEPVPGRVSVTGRLRGTGGGRAVRAGAGDGESWRPCGTRHGAVRGGRGRAERGWRGRDTAPHGGLHRHHRRDRARGVPVGGAPAPAQVLAEPGPGVGGGAHRDGGVHGGAVAGTGGSRNVRCTPSRFCWVGRQATPTPSIVRSRTSISNRASS
jgi:hypothetical protein